MPHTPGPREARRFDDAQIIVLGPYFERGRRKLIGTFTGPDREANAALDAAAPALLVACEAAFHLIYMGDVDGDGTVQQQLKAAVELAEPKGE